MTKRYVTKFKEVREIDEVICNKCGRTEIDPEFKYSIEMHNFKIAFGYYSSNDGVIIDFDLCSDCITEFMESFKVKPEFANIDLTDLIRGLEGSDE